MANRRLASLDLSPKRFVLGAIVAALVAVPARAQQLSVASLMKDGFTLASTIATPAGPGLFLVKADKLFFCVVAETEKSADVATRYCKPVR